MIHILFFLSLVFSNAKTASEINFTGSTPASKIVRDFLNIKHADSIDFIRWKLRIIDQKEYELKCTYGISKPNTNGFINEQKVELKGAVSLNDDVFALNYQGRKLHMLQLNENILHLLNSNGKMMVGNGGWSYTLNSIAPQMSTTINVQEKQVSFSDSIIFDGRTPCRGIEELMYNRTRSECYKKKWRISLYKDSSAGAGTYKIGTVEGRRGNWRFKSHPTGRPIYSLDLNNGNTLDLYHADENVVYLIDKKGDLMVGDHDFSYSLNRKGYEEK